MARRQLRGWSYWLATGLDPLIEEAKSYEPGSRTGMKVAKILTLWKPSPGAHARRPSMESPGFSVFLQLVPNPHYFLCTALVYTSSTTTPLTLISRFLTRCLPPNSLNTSTRTFKPPLPNWTSDSKMLLLSPSFPAERGPHQVLA